MVFPSQSDCEKFNEFVSRIEYELCTLNHKISFSGRDEANFEHVSNAQ